MPSYSAFIGHQPSLSLAELAASVPDFNLTKVIGKDAVVFDSSAELTAKDFSHLGGVIAIAKRVDSPLSNIQDIPDLAVNMLRGVKGKVVFSFRTLGLTSDAVQKLYRQTKNTLKKVGVPSRYVGTPREAAPAVVLHTEQILNGKHGYELTLLSAKDLLWVGQTFAAQDVNAYAKRDMEKPVRDTGVGLLPPKLAQVLLNFGKWLVISSQKTEVRSQKNSSKPINQSTKKPLTVFDPFCGTGVIPMEALLRGWTVLASDSAQKAADGTERNLEWIRKQEKILKRDVPSTVWKQDARRKFELKELPDVVVTETTLGPNLKKHPTLTEIRSLKSENEKLQIEFLENAHTTLPGVPLVVTWPVWFSGKKQVYLEKVLEKLPTIGYEAVLPPGITSHMVDRNTLLYRRPDQFVGREIVLLLPQQKN